MPTVLVTGGTGTLGRQLVPLLAAAGHTPRIMSRRPQPTPQPGIEWAQADLLTGTGLDDAVRGADAIIHAATSPFRNTQEADVEGTRRLLEAARAAGVPHLYYVSIVGIEKIPLGYYKAKLAAEQAVEQGGLPFTILRATQFHTLLDTMLGSMLRRGPFLFVPGAARFQPIDAAEVARHIVATLANGPSGRLPDIGGPQVLSLRDIARDWTAATHHRLLRIPIPALGFVRGFVKAHNTCPANATNGLTWRDWLRAKYRA